MSSPSKDSSTVSAVSPVSRTRMGRHGSSSAILWAPPKAFRPRSGTVAGTLLTFTPQCDLSPPADARRTFLVRPTGYSLITFLLHPIHRRKPGAQRRTTYCQGKYTQRHGSATSSVAMVTLPPTGTRRPRIELGSTELGA
jgi:hypothetical protein